VPEGRMGDVEDAHRARGDIPLPSLRATFPLRGKGRSRPSRAKRATVYEFRNIQPGRAALNTYNQYQTRGPVTAPRSRIVGLADSWD